MQARNEPTGNSTDGLTEQARAKSSIYEQMIDETGRPVRRLPFGIAYETGLNLDRVVRIVQSDPNIMVSNLQLAGRSAYTLTPEGLEELRT